ncbi:ribosomal protein L36e [Cantharellus anzutake]|uniref:ribosomal protein L36e n=1 Tax=Cantharellus anzutake TaxID=1750568 RepID=UPI001902D19E|nr:ribosomal protein L36e [Cantharellus anzutake]KAF8335059.1 ribosomal protein L36e [Cantharellus anzutake]
MVRTNLIVGVNKGHATTPIPKKSKPARSRSERAKLVNSITREVCGFSPYERRVMELLRISKDKKAKKLAKKRLGTLARAKRKLDELSNIITEARRTH